MSQGVAPAKPQRSEAFGLSLAILAPLVAPWAIYLAGALPHTHLSAHWEVVWSGFDLALALAVGSTGIAAIYTKPWLREAAPVTASLLLVDAWFDLLTPSSTRQLEIAAAFAIGAELPVALICACLVRSAYRERNARPRTRHRRSPHLSLVPSGASSGLVRIDPASSREQRGDAAA